MQQSRNVAMAFLLGTFLTGGVLGFSANKYMERDKVCRAKGVQPLADVMANRLALSPEQSTQLDAILDDRAVQYKKAMDPVRPRLDSIKLEARKHMREILDESQRAEFEAMIREMSDTTRKDEQGA